MPTYNQSSFIVGALKSLFNQTFKNWELILINDGCTDETEEIVNSFLASKQVRYIRNSQNLGLGACLNIGFDHAAFDYIAYLPSDDLYYQEHLEFLYKTLSESDAILAASGMLFGQAENLYKSTGHKSWYAEDDQFLQLVQVLHRKTDKRWIERAELISSSLNLMFWNKLKEQGSFIANDKITCEWGNHPNQRSKIINDLGSGGIFRYKQYYNVIEPIYYYGGGNLIDEESLIKDLRATQTNKRQSDSTLKILLVGELSFNPERILALEEQGHTLYGLWVEATSFFTSVGPFVFGNIQTINRDNYIQEIIRIKPDIIYGLLNHTAVSLAFDVRKKFPQIPFVWHFKESPTRCKQLGLWNKLIYLYDNSDGQIYLNEEARNWYGQYINNTQQTSLILDGDLPGREWFKDECSQKLSQVDNEVHTVMTGRPYGLNAEDLFRFAEHKIHLHFYGDIHQELLRSWINEASHSARGYFHIHENCFPPDWTRELSKYDAGWLHLYQAENFGDLTRVSWNELNIAARIPTLAAAGLPMIHSDNSSHISATQAILQRFEMGIFFKNYDELFEKLNDRKLMNYKHKKVWENRMYFCFDHHVNDLLSFFRKVIEIKQLSQPAELIAAIDSL
jgi:glycosyltransferase involved in cell wall biosynthesis